MTSDDIIDTILEAQHDYHADHFDAGPCTVNLTRAQYERLRESPNLIRMERGDDD